MIIDSTIRAVERKMGERCPGSFKFTPTCTVNWEIADVADAQTQMTQHTHFSPLRTPQNWLKDKNKDITALIAAEDECIRKANSEAKLAPFDLRSKGVDTGGGTTFKFMPTEWTYSTNNSGQTFTVSTVVTTSNGFVAANDGFFIENCSCTFD